MGLRRVRIGNLKQREEDNNRSQRRLEAFLRRRGALPIDKKVKWQLCSIAPITKGPPQRKVDLLEWELAATNKEIVCLSTQLG